MGFLKNKEEFLAILKSLFIFFTFVVIVCLLGYSYKQYEKIYPSTEDATLQADIIPVSTNISGRVNQILVANNTLVKQNQILFTLNNTREEIDYQKALAQAKQDADTYRRYLNAGLAGGISNEKITEAQTAMQLSTANVQSAKYAMDNTVIRADRPGIITNFYIQKGQYVTPNTIVGGLIIEHSAWIQANILEPFIERIRSGQAVTFQFRMYPGIRFFGIVQNVGYGIQTGSNSSGVLTTVSPNFNWIYLSKRFPVRIKVLSEDPYKTTPFRVGATVSVTIDTNKYIQNSTAI